MHGRVLDALFPKILREMFGVLQNRKSGRRWPEHLPFAAPLSRRDRRFGLFDCAPITEEAFARDEVTHYIGAAAETDPSQAGRCPPTGFRVSAVRAGRPRHTRPKPVHGQEELTRR